MHFQTLPGLICGMVAVVYAQGKMHSDCPNTKDVLLSGWQLLESQRNLVIVDNYSGKTTAKRIEYQFFNFKTGVPDPNGQQLRSTNDIKYGEYFSYIFNADGTLTGASRFNDLRDKGYPNANLFRSISLNYASYINCGKGGVYRFSECSLDKSKGIYFFLLDTIPDKDCINDAATKFGLTLDAELIQTALRQPMPKDILQGIRPEVERPAGYTPTITECTEKTCPITKCGAFGDGNTFYTSVAAKTTVECMGSCKRDKKCVTSEHRPSTNECWLFDKDISEAKDTDYPSGAYIMNDKSCLETQCNVSADGNESHYIRRDNTTVQECMAFCKYDDNCFASEYKNDGSCWLWGQYVAEVKARDTPNGPYTMNDKECSPAQCNVLADGNDNHYTRKDGLTLQGCKALCKGDNKCLASEYKSGDRYCWLWDTNVAGARSYDDPRGTYTMNDKACPNI